MEPKESKKTVRIFALASFLNDLGSDMIYPIWPLFLTSVLNANMFVLGLIDGLGDALVSISQAISGYISDRIKKRKIFIWTGYLFGSLSRVGYSLSGTWQHVVPFRILDRAGKMRDAPRDAIIADISTKEDRGKNFGLLRMMDNLGATLGIIICILFFQFLGYKNLFLLASIPSLIAVLLVLIFIKERIGKEKIYKGVSLKDFNVNFKLFLFLSSIFSLGFFSYSFLLIYAKEFFSLGFIPVLYLLFTGVAFLFSFYFGKLSDKVGRKAVLFLSYFFWILVCIIFIFIQNYFAILFAFVIYGLHLAAKEPVQRAFVSEISPAEFRASGLGGFQMVNGLCALPASMIAGFLWDNFNKFMPFYFSLFLTILSIGMLIFVKEK